eukprot:scaffold50551_cov57-Phaeocystis_antarctica.AAC.4
MARRLTAAFAFASALFVAAALAGMPNSSIISSAGNRPLSSAEASVAQPASVTWVQNKSSFLSFVSTPVGGGALAGDGGTTRAARPSSPNGLHLRSRVSSAGSRRKAGARATSPASLRAALASCRTFSRGRAPRPRAAASAGAPALPTCTRLSTKLFMAGSAPAPSSSASHCMPSGTAATEPSRRVSASSAGSTEPSLPSVASSAPVSFG